MMKQQRPKIGKLSTPVCIHRIYLKVLADLLHHL